jgi:hypothetical protein
MVIFDYITRRRMERFIKNHGIHTTSFTSLKLNDVAHPFTTRRHDTARIPERHARHAPARLLTTERIPSSPDILEDRLGTQVAQSHREKAMCTHCPQLSRQRPLHYGKPSPARATRGKGERRRRLWVSTVFDISLGYTEQQEWVWSLSSTLGRERSFMSPSCSIDGRQIGKGKHRDKGGRGDNRDEECRTALRNCSPHVW